MKLQLINPPVIEKFGGNSKKGAFPPLSLIALATYVRSKLPWVDVEILDGEIMPFEDIKKKIGGDVVGLSANILNYPNCLTLAKMAKEKKMKVILGGPYTFAMAQSIIKNRPEIDAVIRGEGEEALTSLLEGVKLKYIHNLVYREHDQIIINPFQELNINKLPLPDFSFVRLQDYSKNFKKYFGKKIPASVPGSMFSQRGCLWKELTGGCIYCRPEGTYAVKSSEQVWREIEKIYTTFHIDFIWDVSNSFITNKRWFWQFIDKKAHDPKILLMVYARPNDITLKVAQGLKEVYTYLVLLGVDSGDNKILKNSNTGKRVEYFWKAAKNLESVGVKISISIVLGLPGENNVSLRKTMDLVYKVVELKNLFEISAGILIPLPGTRVFEKILSIPEFYKKYSRKDLFDIEDLQYTWVSNFCEVRYDTLQKTLQEISNVSPITSSFGKKIKDAHYLNAQRKLDFQSSWEAVSAIGRKYFSVRKKQKYRAAKIERERQLL